MGASRWHRVDPADVLAEGRVRSVTVGASYLNFTHEAGRIRDAYGEARYARLVALKDACDPANLFRLNHNIQPSQPAAEPVLA